MCYIDTNKVVQNGISVWFGRMISPKNIELLWAHFPAGIQVLIANPPGNFTPCITVPIKQGKSTSHEWCFLLVSDEELLADHLIGSIFWHCIISPSWIPLNSSLGFFQGPLCCCWRLNPQKKRRCQRVVPPNKSVAQVEGQTISDHQTKMGATKKKTS